MNEKCTAFCILKVIIIQNPGQAITVKTLNSRRTCNRRFYRHPFVFAVVEIRNFPH